MNRREKRRAGKAMRAARQRQVVQEVRSYTLQPGKRTMLATFSAGINVKHWPDVARARARQAAFFRDLRKRDHELARTVWRRTRDMRRQMAGG